MKTILRSLKSEFVACRADIVAAAADVKSEVLFNSIVQIARKAATLMSTASVSDFVKEMSNLENEYIDYFKIDKLGGVFKEAFKALIQSATDAELNDRINSAPPAREKTCCQC